MLGKDSKQLPRITEHYAHEMREVLRRFRSNMLNDADKHTMDRAAKVSRKYNVVWE